MILLGYNGFGNLGDEAVLAGTLRMLSRRGIDEVTVVSGRPEETASLHRVDAVGRGNVLGLRRALKSADGFLLGGGSLLQDTTSTRSLAVYLAYGAFARRYVPAAWWALGIGPLHRERSQTMVARASRRATRVTVRDQASAEALIKFGGAEAFVGSDPALALDRPAPSDERRALAVAPRPFQGQNEEGLARMLAAYSSEFDLDVVLIPFHPPVDEPLCVALARRIGPRATMMRLPDDPVRAIGELASFPLMLSVRLHSMLLSAVAGVPSVYLPYDPKVSAFGSALGLPGAQDPEGLGELLRTTFEERVARREVLASRLQKERERVEEAMDKVLEAL